MMNPSALIEQIQQQFPHLPSSLVRDFITQMDPDYFEGFPVATIAQHVELAHQLTFQQPCAVTIETLPSQQYQLHLVAFSPLRNPHPHHLVPLKRRKSFVCGTACLPGVQLGGYLARSG
jgi:hypothetical protein